MDLGKLIHKTRPSFTEVQKSVQLLRQAHPGMPPQALAGLYIKKIRTRYTTVGAVSALPSVIPGLGTVAQAAVEAGSFSADLLLMLRWMGSICYGTALIYGHDIEKNYQAEFASVLGVWSGVLTPAAAIANTSKVLAIKQFNKHFNERLQNRVNQKIGKKLVAKYGSKKGTSALGKFIPFGVGAVVGGVFNYNTMKAFGIIADRYFRDYGQNDYIER